MELIIQTFFLKLVDNALGTVKNLFLNKEKYFLSALSNSFSTFFYLFSVVQLSKSNNIYGIISACVATFIGTYLPGKIFVKLEKSRVYVVDITSDTLEKGKSFADDLRDLGYAINTKPWNNNELEKVLVAKIYCLDKQEVKTVIDKMPEAFKWNISTSMQTFE